MNGIMEAASLILISIMITVMEKPRVIVEQTKHQERFLKFLSPLMFIAMEQIKKDTRFGYKIKQILFIFQRNKTRLLLM